MFDDDDGVAGLHQRVELANVLKQYSGQNLAGWGHVGITTHFFDTSKKKIEALESRIKFGSLLPGGVWLDIKPYEFAGFERALREALTARRLHDEIDVMELCFAHGVTRQHARPVLKALKDEGVIKIEFQVPDVERLKEPRPIHYC